MRKRTLSFDVTILSKRRQSLWFWNVKIAASKPGSRFVRIIWSTFFVHIHCLNWVPIWKTSCTCLKETYWEFSGENWNFVSTNIYLKQLRMLWIILLCHFNVRNCRVVISLGLIISVYFHLHKVQNTVHVPATLFLSHRTCYRRYMAEILPIRRKTLSNQSYMLTVSY